LRQEPNTARIAASSARYHARISVALVHGTWKPLPGESLLAVANYAGIDAPDVMPAGSTLGLKRSGPRTSTVVRPGWWG